MRWIHLLAACVLAFPASTRTVQADPFTLSTIDILGSGSTVATGISNSGQIVGSFQDGTGSHGFLDNNGAITRIDFPGGNGTLANGINDAGQIVGSFQSSLSSSTAFLDDQGEFMPLEFFGTAFRLSGQAFDINNAGQIAGAYRDPLGTGIKAFIYDSRQNIIRSLPGNFVTEAHGINDAGQVVGVDFFGQDGFLYLNGVFSKFDVPGAQSTQLYGINNSGQIVGRYNENGVTRSFVYTNGIFQPIEIPGSVTVLAGAINDAGQIVGSFTDSTDVSHGFLATPSVPEPSSYSSLGLGLALVTLVVVFKSSKRTKPKGHIASGLMPIERIDLLRPDVAQ